MDQFEFAGYYVAKEKGFYKEAGLDVELKKFDPKISIVNDVIYGNTTYGVSRSSLLIERINNKPVVALSAAFQTSPLVLMATKRSGIRTVADLAGKKVMVANDETEEVSISSMLLSNGIRKQDVNFIPHTFNVDDLIAGKTDAMTAYVSNQPFLLKQKGIETVILDPKDYGFDFYTNILFTSENEILHHRERAEKFNEATLKGYDYAFSHIKETVDIILKKYNTQNKSKEALLYEAKTLKKLAYKKGVNLGSMDINKFHRIVGTYQVLGLVGKDYSLKGFIHEPKNVKNLLTLTTKEKAWLKKHPKIKIGIDIGWPPFEYVDDGKVYQGMAADYIKIIENKLGIKFIPNKELDWAATVEAVKRGDLDMYSCVVKSPQREEYVTFTKPYLSFPMVIVASNRVSFLRGLQDLKGKKVVVVKGYVTEDILTLKHPKLNLITVKNVDDALAMVAYGKAYAYVGNIATSSYYITKGGYIDLKVVGNTPYKFDLGMAVRKDMAPLRDILQKTIDSISKEKTDAIYNKWVTVTYEHQVDYTLLWEVLAGFLVVIAIIILWVRTLKNLNRDLEKKVADKIEELREKDAILLKQSQMAAMGEMIGIIAHQLKQPINAISLSAQLINEEMEYKNISDEALKGSAETIHQQALFMSKTIDDFRNFFNPNKKSENFSVKEAAEKAVNILEVQLGKHSIALIQEGEDFKTHGVASELQHVVLNIINNAKEAILERKISGGKISVTIHSGTITIKDNGGGIEEKSIGKIFEPYFSTKEKYGTGLGLHMVKEIIVKNFKGNITCANENGGAVFTITIPAVK